MAHQHSFDLHTAHTLLLGALLGRFVHTLASPLSLASMRLLCASLPGEQSSLEEAQETIASALADLQRCQHIMQGFNQQLLYDDKVEPIQLDGFVGNLAAAAQSLALFTFDINVLPPPSPLPSVALQVGYLKLLLLSALTALAKIEPERAERGLYQRACVHIVFPDQYTLGLRCSEGNRLACFVEHYAAASRRPLFASGLYWNIVHLSALLGCQVASSEHDDTPYVTFRFAPC